MFEFGINPANNTRNSKAQSSRLGGEKYTFLHTNNFQVSTYISFAFTYHQNIAAEGMASLRFVRM